MRWARSASPFSSALPDDARRPPLLSVALGVMFGVALPHFTISYFIKRRVAQFNAVFRMRSN
jgi:hypothetical protein